jgi:hypothetical protein
MFSGLMLMGTAEVEDLRNFLPPLLQPVEVVDGFLLSF